MTLLIWQIELKWDVMGPGCYRYVVHNFVVSAQAWAFGLEPGPVPAQMAIQ